jgi:uncharacterized integral membrane protein (TIGR00698 family)
LSAALAALAMGLGGIGWLQSHGMSALTVAILLGIVVANTAYGRLAGTCDTGVNFSKQTLLRAGVILYGLRLTLQDIGDVGLGGVLIDGVVLTSTFALAYVLGTRLFGLDRTTSILIGAGSAICGAAAVMATEPIVRAKAEQVTVAVSCVVVFGTLAIFLYPMLYSLNTHWQLIPAGPRAFGIYAGSTIHEVAQVFAAGRSVSIATADTAVVTKMVRVMMLAPFLIALSAWATRGSDHPQTGANRSAVAGDAKDRLRIPWFAFGFIGMVLFSSLALLPQSARTALVDVDTFILAMAMAALGLTTHVSAIRKAGIKPLLLGGVLFIWLILGGGLINDLVERVLS